MTEMQGGGDFVMIADPSTFRILPWVEKTGWLLCDIYFTNGAAIPSLEKDSPKYFNRLYRNDGGMNFTDVTQEAGVAGAGYSMGVAAADYNNDGRVDVTDLGQFAIRYLTTLP